jgi:ribosomal protein S19
MCTADMIQDRILSRSSSTPIFESGFVLTSGRLPIVRGRPGEKVPPIKTQARSATILPNFVGLVFQIHNGKVYNDVVITEDMVGHKLGEFSR